MIMKQKKLDQLLRLRTINEVARFIMRYADYKNLDTFHIPLDIMKSLINGVIPEDEKENETERPSPQGKKD